MNVGVNYPWFDYGWDFGLGPPAWLNGRTTPRWYDAIDADLARFVDLGITVVRWFILADGLTYGTGPEAPRPDPSGFHVWRFDPPPLSEPVLEHFHELLERVAAAQAEFASPIQLLPVLIDFHFCLPAAMPVQRPDPVNPDVVVPNLDWIKQGRADAVADAAKHDVFFDAVLEPLLAASQAHADAIHAWELINEPEWVTSGWHPSSLKLRPTSSSTSIGLPVSSAAMRGFLDEGTRRIRRAGFKTTIGFASIDTIGRTGITADLNQFHHYPGGRRRLARHRFDVRFPGIIGEFATASTDVWPELGRSSQTMLNRLIHADAQGYPLVIPWAFRSADRHTSWSREVEEDLRIFTRG